MLECSGSPLVVLGSDPENLRNAYYISSRAILEKPDFPYVDLQILMKITEMLLWVTPYGLRHFMSFSFFSKSLTVDKIKKTRIINFTYGFPLFLSLGLHQCTWIFHQNLKRNSLKTHVLKHVNSIIIAKTNEIATFRPSRIHIKTICFLFYMKTASPLNIYEKTLKNTTSQKTT